MKIILAVFLGTLLLAGCEERYRYPCQDAHNWNEEFCKKPFCSGNGTCPEDLSHYLKESATRSPSGTPLIQRDNKGPCK